MARPAPPPIAAPLIAVTTGFEHLREGEMQLHRQLGALLGRLRILQALELGQVGAGAEPLPRAGQHDAADRLVGDRRRAALSSRASRELRIERVALLRAIHREDADRAAVFDEQNRDDHS